MASLLDNTSSNDDDDNQDILMMLMMMQSTSTNTPSNNGTTTNVTSSMADAIEPATGPFSFSQLQQPQQQDTPMSSSAQPQEICSRCNVMGGCDVQFNACGCCFHARCLPLTAAMVPLRQCPSCQRQVTTIRLLPMHFQEMEEAKAAAAVAAAELSADNSTAHKRRGQKRKHATLARINPELFLTTTTTAAAATNNHHHNNGAGGIVEGGGTTNSAGEHGATSATNASAPESSDLRTGRWTTEETAYCDKLIELFEAGQLPLLDGIKLHDFLAHMLKSKQSRLTKKMKKAKLSARSYARTSGYIVQVADAKSFSELESGFYASLFCTLERSEIRFHIQREWREQFSSYCVAIGQPVDAEDWLSSVEEMDRRESQAKDAARMNRRKIMMGYALSHDSLHQERGVHIDPTAEGRVGSEDEVPRSPSSNSRSMAAGNNSGTLSENAACDSPNGASVLNGKQQPIQRSNPSINRSAPFLSRVINYLQRHSIPFEHVDAWVPSFVHKGNNSDDPSNPIPVDNNNTCRLCYAGCGTTDTKIEIVNGTKTTVPLSSEDRFNLVSFGEYSQKFSFDVGCGLPGRVYQNGMASWEQMIQNAPRQHFERCGGAVQMGIQTVLGIPVPSPNVGRIVVVFYSRQDRLRDVDIVTRLSNELTKLLPAPKWKLVVDIGVSPFESETGSVGRNGTTPARVVDQRIFTLLGLIVNYMPADKTSPHAAFLPGFTSLKLILQEAVATAAAGSSPNNSRNTTDTPDELLQIILSSAAAYGASGRSESDIAWMTARDYMLLSQQHRQQQQQQQQQLQHQVLMADLLGSGSLSFPSTSSGTANVTNNITNVIHNNHSNDSFSIAFDQQTTASSLAQQMSLGNPLSQATARQVLDPTVLHASPANSGLGFNWSLT